MRTRETYFRDPEIRRERKTLAAATYNLARVLHSRCRPDALFVPIRTMLFLAVIDDEEIIFLDGAASRRRIELAWQKFRPQARSSLQDPVPYEAVFYTQPSLCLMQRLQGEFQRALLQVHDKARVMHTPGTVVVLKR